MTSPMFDLTGEHWPITVDKNGDGPVDEGTDTKEVCVECGKPWPCDSSVLIENLRSALKQAAQRIAELTRNRPETAVDAS